MKTVFAAVILGFLLLFIESGGYSNPADVVGDSLAIRKTYAESPVLSPEESLKKMHVEKGFVVQLVASEPLVTSPVALSFDEQGRIWVAEMETYMPDTLGTGEEEPKSKIIILSDKNGDGVMDERKVFLDSLILPRALCLIENGILVAESPNLWFYEIENDRPVKKTLVDSAYATGGNVEHQPNGLLRALDNWIYNAKSSKRYRKKGDKWLIERTHFRGQWGITQDDLGRLYYNTNSENLLGDYFTPGFGSANHNVKDIEGFNEPIVRNNRVFAARATTGVNRGYMEGILNDSLRLVNFTAACGPVIYGSTFLGKEFYGNAFVAEPSANLIKRNILKVNGNITTGRQAYPNREFMASEDERFRPVNLYEGPGGALYIVDMYRGIIQHKAFLTDYLKKEIKERNLTLPLSLGRIYKVVPKDKNEEKVTITKDLVRLMELLKNGDGWARNQARQMLIDGKYVQAAPALRDALKTPGNPTVRVHLLWAMEGLGVLQLDDVLPLLKGGEWPVRLQALSVLPSIISKSNYKQVVPALNEMVQKSDTLAAPYVAFLGHYFRGYDTRFADKLLMDLVSKYPTDKYIADAVISSLKNREAVFYKQLASRDTDTASIIYKRLRTVTDDIVKTRNNKNIKQLEKQYPKGVALYQTNCQPCHGPGGNGVRALGPPLNNSNWVVGDKSKLISIVLYGLTGPVKVGDKLYTVPEISGEMPAIGQNKEVKDSDIAQILSFIRNSWNNKADIIDSVDVINIRNKFKGRQKAFTMEELNKQ